MVSKMKISFLSDIFAYREKLEYTASFKSGNLKLRPRVFKSYCAFECIVLDHTPNSQHSNSRKSLNGKIELLKLVSCLKTELII